MNTNLFRALALAASLLPGSMMAQSGMPGMDMNKPATGMSTPGMNMNVGGMDMATMAAASLEKLSGRAFDRAFLSMMIPHHRAALGMATSVLALRKDAQVRAWANTVVRSQQAEIVTMTALLTLLGGSDPRMAAVVDRMKGVDKVVGRARNPDVAFVQGMLPHHDSAIDTAKIALQRSSGPRVLKIAQDTVLAQAREMYGFRNWLTEQ